MLVLHCNLCGEDNPKILYHTLKSDKQHIEVCDHCFQEVSMLKKNDKGEWETFIIQDGIRFYK